jgi:predicted dehydrogenase
MGISHFAIMNGLEDVRVTAVCDTSGFVLSTLKKHAPVETYKDYKDMIDEAKLDCVIVATPTKLHAESARYALEKDLHVFVEKPFCLTPEEGRGLVELATKKKRVNQVGYNNRFIGTFIETKRIVQEGLLGDIFHVTGEVYGPVVVKEQASTWRSKKSEGGGCLRDYCPHILDLMSFVVGPPKQILGSILRTIYSKDVDDAVYATMVFDKGVTGLLSANWSDETYRKITTRLTIQGSRGKVVTDRQECQLYLREGSTEGANGFHAGWNIRYITELQKPVSFYLRGEEYSAQLEYFVDAVRQGKTDNLNSFASALETDIAIAEVSKTAMKARN